MKITKVKKYENYENLRTKYEITSMQKIKHIKIMQKRIKW